MSDRLSKDSAIVEEVEEEHRSLVQVLIEQSKGTLELLKKQQAEHRSLISKLEITTQQV